MTDHDRRTIQTDLDYAVRQLRDHRDVGRALDALERIQANLSAPASDFADNGVPTEWTPDEILRREG